MFTRAFASRTRASEPRKGPGYEVESELGPGDEDGLSPFSYPEPFLRAVNGRRRGALAKSISNWHLIGYNERYCSNNVYTFTMFLWFPVLDLARAPRPYVYTVRIPYMVISCIILMSKYTTLTSIYMTLKSKYTTEYLPQDSDVNARYL